MEAETHPPAWKTLLAFAIIYFVWGSTFLAIRVGVREVPPFLLAAMRFLAAGLVLCGWIIGHGERSPNRRQWFSAFLLWRTHSCVPRRHSCRRPLPFR